MKKLSLCVVVALLSVTSFARAQSLNQPYAPLHFEPTRTASDEEIPNPFDMLGTETGAPAPTVQPAPIAPAPKIEAEISNDPTSLPVPVGRHHRRNRSIVDTMANYGDAASIPDAYAGPVDWGYGHPTAPNYTAEVLLREDCIRGIWDGYSAMRAAECAKQWERLTAQKCHGGCGAHQCSSCKAGGCAVNRYTNSNCDTCNQCASSIATMPPVMTASATGSATK